MCMWRFRGVLIAPGIYWHCGCVALRAYLCSGLSGCQLLRRRPSCSWMSTWSNMRRGRRSVRKNVTVWTWTGEIGQGWTRDRDSGQWTSGRGVDNCPDRDITYLIKLNKGVNGQACPDNGQKWPGQMSTVWFQGCAIHAPRQHSGRLSGLLHLTERHNVSLP